jgi:hypothetical protein
MKDFVGYAETLASIAKDHTLLLRRNNMSRSIQLETYPPLPQENTGPDVKISLHCEVADVASAVQQVVNRQSGPSTARTACSSPCPADQYEGKRMCFVLTNRDLQYSSEVGQEASTTVVDDARWETCPTNKMDDLGSDHDQQGLVPKNEQVQVFTKTCSKSSTLIKDDTCRETHPTTDKEVLINERDIDRECDPIHEAPRDLVVE